MTTVPAGTLCAVARGMREPDRQQPGRIAQRMRAVCAARVRARRCASRSAAPPSRARHRAPMRPAPARRATAGRRGAARPRPAPGPSSANRRSRWRRPWHRPACRALSCVSAAACSGVTPWPSRNAISASMPGALKCMSPKSAGLARTPAGGSGACVSTASRDGPPDFQWPGRRCRTIPSQRPRASCTRVGLCRIAGTVLPCRSVQRAPFAPGRGQRLLPASRHASTFTLPSLTTLAHLSISLRDELRELLARAAAVFGAVGVEPLLHVGHRQHRVDVVVDLLRDRPSAACPGPTRPYQVVASKPGKPCSCIVGTLGWPLARLVRVCAIAITLPLFTCGVAAVMVSKLYWIWPPIRSVSSGPAALVRHVQRVDLGLQLEHLERQVLRRAGAGRAEAHLAGLAPCTARRCPSPSSPAASGWRSAGWASRRPARSARSRARRCSAAWAAGSARAHGC